MNGERYERADTWGKYARNRDETDVDVMIAGCELGRF
jgi:hypothetical protein